MLLVMKLDKSWSVNILCRMFTPGQCHILVVKLRAFIFGLAYCKCHWNLSWSLQRSFGDFLMANKNLYRTNVNSFGINGSMIVSSRILGIWNVKRYFCGFNLDPRYLVEPTTILKLTNQFLTVPSLHVTLWKKVSQRRY